METNYQAAYQWAIYHRPQIEQRARAALGVYWINLAREWCLLLKSIL